MDQLLTILEDHVDAAHPGKWVRRRPGDWGRWCIVMCCFSTTQQIVCD